MLYAFDPTPKSVSFVKMQSVPVNFRLYEYGLSDKDETTKFYLPVNDNYVSGSEKLYKGVSETKCISVEMRRFESLMEITGNSDRHINLIKMDIEGSEFSAIPDILKSGITFDQLCVETHQRFFDNGNEKIKDFIQTLNDEGYYIISVSDDYQELTFERF